MPAKKPNPLAPSPVVMAEARIGAARVVLVEDDSNLRRTILSFINRSPGFCCAGTFPDGESALAGIPDLKPDVILMDINLPGMSGIDCVSALKQVLPTTPIVMLTVYDEGDFLFDSLKAGASGYLLKRSIGEKLPEAMQEALAGGVPLTRHMAVKVARYFQQIGLNQKDPKDEKHVLTPREQEIVRLLADCYRFKEIAAELGISLDTVREHSRRIYAKLHVNSRAEAVVKFFGGTPKDPGNA